VFFTESQDLKERPLHPGLTVGGIEVTTENAQCINDVCSTTHLAHIEEAGSELPETTLCRSARIAKTSGSILGEKSSVYTQFSWDEVHSKDSSLQDDTGTQKHCNTNMDSGMRTLKDTSILLSTTRNGAISAMKMILYHTGTPSRALTRHNGNQHMRTK